MPVRTLILKPGVNVEVSPTAGTFYVVFSNLVRFYQGFIQQLGGWSRKVQQTFIGTASGAHGWADIVGNVYVAVGTDQRLQVLAGGTIQDITPLAATDNPAVAFSTTSGQNAVTVTDGARSPAVGDWTYQVTYTSVGGLIIHGFYLVQTVPTGTTYTINAAAPATATVNNGGAVAAYTSNNGTSTVKVTLNNHGLTTGALFTPGVSVTVGGVTVVAGTIYSVTVIDANNFNITVTGTATSSAGPTSENSGNAQIQYLLPTGSTAAQVATGFGSGLFGAGLFGGASQGSSSITPLRQWSLDHFGQDLIASPTNGKIYFWQPPNATPASVVSGSAPVFNAAVFVMPQVEIIFALGAEVGGTQQPLLGRWCDVGDFTNWTATATDQAGSFSFASSSGSKLVGGLAVGLGGLIWTDKDIWQAAYIGFPLVWSFNKLAQECGLIAMRAAGTSGTIVEWLSPGQFWRMSLGGAPAPMECPVWDFYWYNVDQTQAGKIFAAVNSLFNEIAWFFPLKPTSPLWSATAPMAYVKHNYVEDVWDFGLHSLYQRTAWAPASPAGNPIGCDLNSLLQEHEVGFDADGAVMPWSWQAGYADLNEGDEIQFADKMIPDFAGVIGNPVFVPTILGQGYPNDTPVAVATFPPTFTKTTQFITFGVRARQLSIGFKAGPGNFGAFSRIGKIRVFYQSDGKAS